MAEEFSPSQIRARRFDMARRGYDRAAVDDYLALLADELERLSATSQRAGTHALKVGIDDPEALAAELSSIGAEISEILEAARSAATGMRTRATDDASNWRVSADAEVGELRETASEQSQSMRASAWKEGSAMLASALGESGSVLDAAKEDALFIRAEAEREAIRLTGDAKRDREESLRTARLEAEQLVDGAIRESDGIMASASKQAEQAQERARALEDRRTELLAELESTRDSISVLEHEIDSRRQEMVPQAPEPLVPEDNLSHHSADSGSVRIVAPSRALALAPVDAEDLVADVVAIRSGKAKDSEAPSDVTVPQPAEEAPPVATVAETVTVISPPVPAPEPVAEAVPASRPVPQAVLESPIVPAPEPAQPAAAQSDDLGSLFASLRSTGDVAVAPEVETPAREVAATSAPAPTPPPSIEPTVSEPVAPVEPAKDAATPVSSEPSASLIPLQNAALKEIKRTLVDMQADALESLRDDGSWVPAPSFAKQFKAPFSKLAKDISGSAKDGGAAKRFSGDLHGAIVHGLESARESGAGDREVASTVSRVFRLWRADESERRVVDAAELLSQD